MRTTTRRGEGVGLFTSNIKKMFTTNLQMKKRKGNLFKLGKKKNLNTFAHLI